MSNKPDQIAYLDLRYTSGMAIGWKNNISWLGRG
jgi:cell division septal protein FtsQ